MARAQAEDLWLELAEGRPIGNQLQTQLREAIRRGRLLPATRLPSSRALADQLGVSRGSVVGAYEQLGAEGYLVSRHGSGTEVASLGRQSASPHPSPDARTSFRFDFHPGQPDLERFPRPAWMNASRRVFASMAASELGYGQYLGADQLRQELSEHLGRSRGLLGDPGHIVITNGFIQGLDVVCRTLAAKGLRRVAVEDPCWNVPRLVISRCGLEVCPVPVDQDGVSIEAIERVRPDAVMVTPAHQCPTGVVLSQQRRLHLLELARDQDFLIIEDDYDSEFRYDRRPVGCVQGLDPDRVVYLGSASKILAPALRLGWVVLPDALVGRAAGEKLLSDGGSNLLAQLTLAEFMRAGELGRHLRRMRLHYRSRRDTMVGALARHVPQATVRGVAAGLSLMVELPNGVSERDVVQWTEAAGMRLDGLSSFYSTKRAPHGLVLGYAASSPDRIRRGVKLLGQAIDRAGSPSGQHQDPAVPS